MLCLSDEVLLMILENLYYVDDNLDISGQKNDLLSTRAVCRRLANIGQDLSFKYITFIQMKKVTRDSSNCRNPPSAKEFSD